METELNRKAICGLTVKSLSDPPRVSIVTLKAGRAAEVFAKGKFRSMAWQRLRKNQNK